MLHLSAGNGKTRRIYSTLYDKGGRIRRRVRAAAADLLRTGRCVVFNAAVRLSDVSDRGMLDCENVQGAAQPDKRPFFLMMGFRLVHHA